MPTQPNSVVLSEKKTDKSLFLLLLLSFLVHVPFVLRGFGESDAARLANDTIFFAKGHIPVTTTIWSSPAYIFLLEKCLTIIDMPASSLPTLLRRTFPELAPPSPRPEAASSKLPVSIAGSPLVGQ